MLLCVRRRLRLDHLPDDLQGTSRLLVDFHLTLRPRRPADQVEGRRAHAGPGWKSREVPRCDKKGDESEEDERMAAEQGGTDLVQVVALLGAGEEPKGMTAVRREVQSGEGVGMGGL